METRALRCEGVTRCTCPSCSPPTWPSVQILPHEYREHSLASKVPLLFFHLCAPAHGQNHGLIFQNMFLARTPPSSLYASLLMPLWSPPPTSSLTHSPFPVHHLFSPLLSSPHPTPNMPACLLARPNVWYLSISHVLLLQCSLQSNHQCCMFYGLIRNYPGTSSQAVEEPKAEGWSDEAEGERGRVPSAVEF